MRFTSLQYSILSNQLANLHICLEKLTERYQAALIYIRGDSKVNQNNSTRVALFGQFLEKLSLQLSCMSHKTYHHFVGNGMYDSNIDIIGHSNKQAVAENVTRILCKHEYPQSNSHHDIILSQFNIPFLKETEAAKTNLTIAPRCSQSRSKITWL